MGFDTFEKQKEKNNFLFRKGEYNHFIFGIQSIHSKGFVHHPLYLKPESDIRRVR